MRFREEVELEQWDNHGGVVDYGCYCFIFYFIYGKLNYVFLVVGPYRSELKVWWLIILLKIYSYTPFRY